MSLFKSSTSITTARALVEEKYANRFWSDLGEITLERIKMPATFLHCKGQCRNINQTKKHVML